MAQAQGLRVRKIPEAGRWIGRGAFRPVAGWCDYMLIDQDGRVAFVDCKSLDSEVITASLINDDQVKFFESVGDLCPAGYVVFFRPANIVVFYDWTLLRACAPGTSLNRSLGHHLGTLSMFTVPKIYTCKPSRSVFTLSHGKEIKS
jgi:hypothetical protein